MFPFSKRPAEKEVIGIDFTSRIDPPNLTITDRAISITRVSGTGILAASNIVIINKSVACIIDGGDLGDVYEVVISATLSDTQIKEEYIQVTIDKDDV